MSSYVTVLGIPTGETCCVFGLTPQEVRYLQSKFPDHVKHDELWNPKHGIRLECACIVVLNALGYIGFKVVSTAGNQREYMWTLERNLDMDTQYQAPDYDNLGLVHYSYTVHPHHHLSDDGISSSASSRCGRLAPPSNAQNRRHSLTEKIANALRL